MGDFKLTLEPTDKIVFTGGAKLGVEPVNLTIKITNPLKERVAFKVKCTSNDMFKIRPPVGILKPDESATVTLQFQCKDKVPENGKQYFAFYHTKVGDDEKKTARQVWADGPKDDKETQKKIYVDFKKEDGGDEKKEDSKDDKKEEKKEEEKKEEKK